jgi:hypothetical protein
LAILLALVVGLLSITIANAQKIEPSAGVVLQQGQDVPYDICLKAKTWLRPTEMEQRQQVWHDPRYGPEEMQKTLPQWTEDFLVYDGGADEQGKFIDWAGFWTAAGQITQKQDGLCQHRQADVSLLGQQEEVWLKYHRLISLKRLDNTVVFVVEPQTRGFQAIDFLRQGADTLQLIFVNSDGREIVKIEHAQLPTSQVTYLKPANVVPPVALPTTGAAEQSGERFLGWIGWGMLLIVTGRLLRFRV